MAVEVVMPKLGMAMKEGTVSLWNKGVGDSVEKGEPIASVNSEKIEIDVESPAEGTVLKITVPEGEGVPPGTVICFIGKPGEEVAVGQALVPVQKPEVENEASANKPSESIPARKAGERVKISPIAKKMAEAANLNIEEIQGSGPGGRITKEDVQDALKKSSIQKKEKSEEKPVGLQEETQQVTVSGIRKVIAARMYDSLQKTAQLTINMKIDVTELIALQKQTAETIKNRYDQKLTLTDYIARAVVLSLQQHQQMNSALIDDKIHLFKSVHLGMAVALDRGLVVPVIRNADTHKLIDLSRTIKELAKKARQGQLSNEEMQGSTFTISNLGSYGVEHFTPVLNPPETGILGVGAVYDTPSFVGDKVERRSILPLSLTFDHRVLDGAPAAAFLQTVKQYLEEPITMLL
ncbi:branched-chain alpha-keto acid dehydrogenase subunit E2 [Bacillus sp. AFS076308]|uniref:dihydrolipoamide acetyltransferase family protein n=1 Tax=unclassified Bacillus (in: firmicutes) TaxID=185979 RepID=UPI000BF514B5|nr:MULTISPECIES: dihydrolipoamide acetyltransferase family protein [unclassified Bacillus (in: firmicutes)]PFN98111.1 branched-chain alpha-keto acid dehydrogenase subunit E2 [Bacillus sp. AFS076308]PGV50826.1 branched-chain alpha-keto acid dehydrogenase subunit E2 [Bacillus sp. AFS037270]